MLSRVIVAELMDDPQLPRKMHVQALAGITRLNYWSRSDSFAGNHWFAVGDAAGYVEPFTGEGMAWAINGALALAPIVHSAGKKWEDAHVQIWNRTHARLVDRRQLACRLISKLLRSQRLTSWMICTLDWCPIVAKLFIRHLHRSTHLRSVEVL